MWPKNLAEAGSIMEFARVRLAIRGMWSLAEEKRVLGTVAKETGIGGRREGVECKGNT